MSTRNLEVTFYGSGNAQVDVPVSAATRCSVIVKELAFFCAVSATVAVLDQQSVAGAFMATAAGTLTAAARQNYTHELETYLTGNAKVPTLKPVISRSLSFTGVGGTPSTFKSTAQFVVAFSAIGRGVLSPPAATRWAGLQGPLTLTATGAFSARRERLCKSEMTSDASVIGQAYRTHDCYVAISRNAKSIGLDGFGGRVGGAKGSPDALPNSYNPFGRDPDTITNYGGRLDAGLKTTLTGTGTLQIIQKSAGLACMGNNALRIEPIQTTSPKMYSLVLRDENMFVQQGNTFVAANCCCSRLHLALFSNSGNTWARGTSQWVELYTIDECRGLIPLTDDCGYQVVVQVKNLFTDILYNPNPWFVRYCIVFEDCDIFYLVAAAC